MVWLQAIFKISSFLFKRRKKSIQVWNNMRMCKWWFGGTIPLNCSKNYYPIWYFRLIDQAFVVTPHKIVDFLKLTVSVCLFCPSLRVSRPWQSWSIGKPPITARPQESISSVAVWPPAPPPSPASRWIPCGHASLPRANPRSGVRPQGRDLMCYLMPLNHVTMHLKGWKI